MTPDGTLNNNLIRPLRDAFGTRIDPDTLRRGLLACGLRTGRVILTEEGLTLQHAAHRPEAPAMMRAATYLRECFSPLFSIALEQDASAPDDRIMLDDRRIQPETRIVLAQWDDEAKTLSRNVAFLLERLGRGSSTAKGAPLPLPDTIAPVFGPLAARLGEEFARFGWAPTRIRTRWIRADLATCAPVSGGPEKADLELLVIHRPLATEGFRPGFTLAASVSATAMAWLLAQLCEGDTTEPGELILDGLCWELGRRPVVAACPDASQAAIRRESSLCLDCGRCERLCPVGILGPDGELREGADWASCLLCMDCVEACPADARRPSYGPSSSTHARHVQRRPGWLARLAGRAGPAFPPVLPPSYLLPRTADTDAPPRVVLGLSITTMQEHAAVLMKDGEILGAVEEERLVRIRHYGWSPAGRPGVTLSVDPTLALEEAICNRSVRALLGHAGLTRDDIDLIAVNGLPARYRRVRSLLDTEKPLPVLQSGRLCFVPHHLAHAASCAYVSGETEGWVFTVDGRGDRETAALFELRDGVLNQKAELLSLTDQSIGAVYEAVTAHLGFGSHGQGSVMALASFGTPDADLSPFLSARGFNDVSIHENGLIESFPDRARQPDEPVRDTHRNLAASLQQALEESVHALLDDGGVPPDPPLLALAGGVSLNCRMNQGLRRRYPGTRTVIQPAANDAGTALGAGLVAWKSRRPEAPLPTMTHVYWGPEFDDATIEAALRRRGIEPFRPEDISTHAAQFLASGKVLCWFSGRMEFGPRALGARSILADPRNPAIKDRVNGLKEREAWRPFGPSILAGHEQDWFSDAFDSRFMLVTADVFPERREAIPAVMHVDGTTRPQVVHADTHPAYHRLISAFHKETGIPMLLNTSFNRRGEPIVCTPDEALDCFLDMKADALALGPYWVDLPGQLPAHPLFTGARTAPPQGGRRLSLRMTTECTCKCAHCTLTDMPVLGRRSAESIRDALIHGGLAGCDELVLMRGEPLLHPDILDTISFARAIGYRYIQVQTNGQPLADIQTRQILINAGLDGAEILLWAATPNLHDRLSGLPGSSRKTLLGLRGMVEAERFVLVTVPVIRDNCHELTKLASLCAKLGVWNLQFTFPRPLELVRSLKTDRLLRLAEAARLIGHAAEFARQQGLNVTTEGLPLCLLPAWLHQSPDAREDWTRHRIDDLHILHESLGSERNRARPLAPVCRSCSRQSHCPTTWALYQELFGSGEFTPFSD